MSLVQRMLTVSAPIWCITCARSIHELTQLKIHSERQASGKIYIESAKGEKKVMTEE